MVSPPLDEASDRNEPTPLPKERKEKEENAGKQDSMAQLEIEELTLNHFDHHTVKVQLQTIYYC